MSRSVVNAMAWRGRFIGWRSLFVGVGVIVLTGCGGANGSPTGPTTTASPAPTQTPTPIPAPVPTPTPVAPVNIAGTYSLVLTASPVCASNLPTAARIVRYGATIAQLNADFQTSLTGGDFSSAIFAGTLSGPNLSSLYLTIGDLLISDGTLIVSFSGTGTVSSTGSFGGMFSGSIQSGMLSSAGSRSCNAFDHQFQFTRR